MSNHVRYMYLRNRNKHIVGCLAIRLLGDTSNVTGVDYQLSVLNPKDRFNRQTARDLAKTRLQAEPITVNLDEDFGGMSHITHTIMTHLTVNKEVPNRARKSAEDWLLSRY